MIDNKTLQENMEMKRLLEQTSQMARVGGWEKCFQKGTDFWSDMTRQIHEVGNDFVPTMENSIAFYKEGEHRNRIIAAVEHTLETGEPFDVEVILVTAKGRELWVRAIGNARFEGGKCTGLYGTFQDIDDRKRMEEELRLQKEQYELVINGTNDGIWDWNLLNNELFLSKRWKNILGYQEFEIENSYDAFIKLVYEDDLERVNAYVISYLEGQIDDFAIEFRMKHKDGSVRWILARGEALRDQEGVPYRMAGSHSDITARKHAEESLRIAMDKAEAASQAKSDFLANMSHEIRTPLNAIVGFTDLMLKTPLESLQRRYCENVNASAKNLQEIIDAILDFSKIEAGKLELDYVETNMTELFKQALDMVKYQAFAKGLDVFLHIQPEMYQVATVDPLRLKQIIVNLLSNAVKFTDSGQVVLEVAFAHKKNGIGSYCISVKDTGIGISEEEKTKLFKAFSQADGSTSRKFGGTGLGLVIANQLAEKMGSSIEVCSVPGAGSTFFFTIETTCQSLADNFESGVDVSNQEMQSYQNHIPQSDQRQRRQNIQDVANIKTSPVIVIAEDIPLNMILIKALLKEILPEVTPLEAVNGTEALEMIKDNHPDLVLMDIQMPKIDGIEVTRLVREWQADQKNTKKIVIIALTAGAFREEQEKAYQAGMDEFLKKPIEFNKLRELIEKYTFS